MTEKIEDITGYQLSSKAKKTGMLLLTLNIVLNAMSLYEIDIGLGSLHLFSNLVTASFLGACYGPNIKMWVKDNGVKG